MKAPGSGLLKTSSVIYIIFGGLATLLYLLALLGVGALAGILSGFSAGVATVAGGVLGIFIIFPLLGNLLEFIIGILGFRKADDPDQAGFFIWTGVIIGVIQLVGLITSFNWITLISFILPVLYVIGGMMNRRAAVN